MMKQGGSEPRYCVIGAGAAGLAAMQALAWAGMAVDCFEKDATVGGHWNTDYDSLHLITSSKVTGFPEYPMPADFPMFPSRRQMLAYLNAYADHFALRDRISFGTEVVDVRPAEGEGAPGAAGWLVTTAPGGPRLYDGVFVANGHLWKQRIPQVAGGFAGRQIHSGSYRRTADIEGETVLVVGCGNSGCDLAVDAAQAGLNTHIVMRRGHYFQPKTYFGRPRAELAFMQEFLPEEQDLIARLMMRLSVGTHADYPGMPAPDHRTLAEGPPVVNELLLYWIRHGRIAVRPELRGFEGRRASFADGTALDVDTVLWATGFDVSFPFMDHSLFSWENGVPRKVGASVFPVGIEKLYLIGLVSPRGPQPPVYSMQAKLALTAARLHGESANGSAPVSAFLARKGYAEAAIDTLRHLWLADLGRTEALLGEFARDSDA